MPVIKRVTLTKVVVDAAKPRNTAYRLWDAKVPGLALRVMPSGRKSYELHWGRNKSHCLGQHGVVALDAARESAHRIYGEVAEHGAPLAVVDSRGSPCMRFGQFIDDRYGPHVVVTAKAGTATLKSIQKHFAFLNEKSLGEVSRADFDKFKAERLADGTHPATVNRDLDRLKAALSKAVEWGMLPSNPLQGVRRIKRDIEERSRFLSSREEERLRNTLTTREESRRFRRLSGERWRARRGREALGELKGYTDHLMPMTLLALNTGLRRGELTQLRWADIDMSGKYLTVRAGYAKSGKARHVPMNTEVVAILTQYRKQHRTEGPLFKLHSMTTSWRRLMAEARIKAFRFHDLRHTFASKLVMAGVDLNTVRELLGHGDIKMTLRYAHLAPEHKAAAVQMLVKANC